MATPQWLVWCPEDGETVDGVRSIIAHDAEHAAEEWAARDDYASADYRIVGGESLVVHVVPADRSEPAKRFRVRGESVPTYYAEELEADEP